MARRRDIGPVEPRRPRTAVDMARDISVLHQPLSDAPVLIADETRIMAACEAAITTLQAAFWAAGKALQVIRDGRLYRTTHATFEEYVEERWGMSRPQAYRLIEAWPLAERIGMSPIGDTALSESHVRVLLPVAKRHGEDAAAAVYQTIARADGVRVTAQLLAEAVRILPSDGTGAAEAVRAWLDRRDGKEDQGEAERTAPSAVAELAAEIGKVRTILHRLEQRGTVQRAAVEDAEAARRLLEPLGAWSKTLEAAQD